ncbi:MAG: hypothetical protein ACRCZ2_10085 [Fusobacteriaceae bacterium]
MQFTKNITPILNFNQEIRTNTSGANIGLNQIITSLDSNFDELELLTNKNLVGGGLSDENIKIAGITNISTNLLMNTVDQAGNLDVNYAGTGSYSESAKIQLLNGSFTTPTTNKKVSVFSDVGALIVSNSPDTTIAYIELQLSTSPTFTSILTQRAIYYGITGVPQFASRRQFPVHISTTLPTATTYYFRLRAWVGGVEPNLFSATFRFLDSKATYFLN